MLYYCQANRLRDRPEQEFKCAYGTYVHTNIYIYIYAITESTSLHFTILSLNLLEALQSWESLNCVIKKWV